MKRLLALLVILSLSKDLIFAATIGGGSGGGATESDPIATAKTVTVNGNTQTVGNNPTFTVTSGSALTNLPIYVEASALWIRAPSSALPNGGDVFGTRIILGAGTNDFAERRFTWPDNAQTAQVARLRLHSLMTDTSTIAKTVEVAFVRGTNGMSFLPPTNSFYEGYGVLFSALTTTVTGTGLATNNVLSALANIPGSTNFSSGDDIWMRIKALSHTQELQQVETLYVPR